MYSFHFCTVYTVENDFAESGVKEFTLFDGDPFPPQFGCPLVIFYRTLTT